ncbi:hypothetical protein BOTBODRAFT_182787 [Botryobasidium botryosum FD-172 SS1]|uniref:Uncharacterized protein n=1 Tax=Botryobasidium botryosum (strain FD-172 SS1) TaxID=930990 RepID=A0A067N0T0_BOTB1|nr:hypothetical protein BOTBODRAFT_182787 [Botryobasidium botryosum FD-172 SS1]
MMLFLELLVAIAFESALALAKGAKGGHGEEPSGGNGNSLTADDLCPGCPMRKKIAVGAGVSGGLLLLFIIISCCVCGGACREGGGNRMIPPYREMAGEASGHWFSDSPNPTKEEDQPEEHLGIPPAYTSDEKNRHVSMPAVPPGCAISQKTYDIPPATKTRWCDSPSDINSESMASRIH